MANLAIAQQRLHNQHIIYPHFNTSVELVRYLGAVQSQDYPAAKWALGLRLQGITDNDIEQAFTNGDILRTHVMRPTWHFVAPADIRWLLKLTGPRVHTGNASRYRQLEIDDTLKKQTAAILTKALQGGKQLTRPELAQALQQAGIETDVQRLTHIIMHAELEGVLCSGARRDKQFTYALLEERVPPTKPFVYDEALAELTSRYFTSHGPATIQDFVWWSGLTVAEARTGLAMVQSRLSHDEIDGRTYWFASSVTSDITPISPIIHLLPNYDEYIVSYTDRSAVFDTSYIDKLDARANVLFTHTVALDGQIIGTWKRTLKKDTIVIAPNFFIPLNDTQQNAFLQAIKRLGAFLTMPITCI